VFGALFARRDWRISFPIEVCATSWTRSAGSATHT
jgi:hypothetical protein